MAQGARADLTAPASRGRTGTIVDLLALTSRRDLLTLGVLMTATSLTEGIGVLALVPVLAALDGTGHRPGWFVRLVETTGVTPTIGGMLAVTLCIAIARTMLIHAQTLANARMRNRTVDRLRIMAFSAVIRADWRWLSQARASDFGNFILTNVNHVGFGLTSVLGLGSTAIVGATYLATCLLLSWQVTLMTFVVGGAVLAAFAGQRRRALLLGEKLGETRSEFHGFVQQGLAGVRLIKAFGTEDARIAQFTRTVDMIRDRMEQYEQASSLGQRTLQIGGLILLSAIVYIGYAVLHVALSTLLPLLFVFARLVPLVSGIQQNWSSWNHVRPALIETQRLLAETAAVREPGIDPARPAIALEDALTLDHVSVKYQGRSVAALDAVSLTLRAKTTTAICGPSGAGKSTLADVVMGLIAPDAGTLAVDGRDIAGDDRVHWRRSIAYVQQDPFLFHDSIRVNLLLDRPGIGEDEMRAAVTRAGAEFVLRLPEGLDTVVGDGGVRLSGGERQRVALARALIGDPALIILDEATSALDPENELAVRRTMAALRGSVTLLFISHRTSMQEEADQIIELDGGRLRVVAAYTEPA